MKPRAIAAIAPIVGEAAAAGDAVAARIVDIGAAELAGSAVSVATRLGLRSEVFPLPLAGGIFRSVPQVRWLVMTRLREQLPTAQPTLLEVEPAQGAVRLASGLVQGTVRVPVYLDATH